MAGHGPLPPLLASLIFLSVLVGTTLCQNSSPSSCPLDFSVLRKFIAAAEASPGSVPADAPTRCAYALQGLHLVQAQYLRTTGLFLPAPASAAACWSAYQSIISPIFPTPFHLLSDCGFEASWISQGCMNITSRAAFESLVPPSARDDMDKNCNRSLLDVPPCTACTTSLSRVHTTYLTGPDHGNVSSCTAYPFIYAGGLVNRFGPADDGTAVCLFLLNATASPPAPHHSSNAWIFGLVAGCLVFVLLAVLLIWFFIRMYREERRTKKKKRIVRRDNNLALESIRANTALIRFKFEEIKAATNNFSRDNIIGIGGYGNVYRGVLSDGSEVAVKRFKNCSVTGDVSFAHEVEVIASVRHVNLVALRGYSIATSPLEGHQRIIVCDLMPNGSLHDHLFSSTATKLSWPIRQKIAVGTARGLSYLHYGAQPVIMHRDIKASNILLDERFEPKVADFGLAKFAPEGMSHVSTRVAGTVGYVAPEYALYGQLTQKSDVYSFGVVLLELLSGKKAFISKGEGDTWVITDWAWSLVQKGKVLDVIEEGMDELGPEEVMEKYVLVAVLASHPEMHARPTMDQIVKMLETDVSVLSIPDRPIPLISPKYDIERSVSGGGSGQPSTSAGYQQFTVEDRGNTSEGSEIV